MRHNTEVQLRSGFGRTVHVALCSCGWESQPQPTKRAAENEATDHVVAVTQADA